MDEHSWFERRERGFALVLSVMMMALLVAGCGTTTDSEAQAPDGPPSVAASAGDEQSGDEEKAPEESYFPDSSLELSEYTGPIESSVTIAGEGFPAGRDVKLVWKTYDGRYVLEQNDVVFVGPRYEERLDEIATATADSEGHIEVEFTVPEDFGGVHNIMAYIDGQFAAKTAYTITPTFTVSRYSGPVGTPLTIKATGLGYRPQESLWEVTWDNSFTGYMMAVNTHGTAQAHIRITGDVGPHVLKIWRNYRGVPYLNPHQGPFGALPESTFTINVTEGAHDAPAIWADPLPKNTVRTIPSSLDPDGPSLMVTPNVGTVGSMITIKGEGFPPDQPVNLSWATRTGQKITETGLLEGFEEKINDLSTLTADKQGNFTLKMDVPNDYAGAHPITAESDDQRAETYFSIYPSIIEFTESARVGENIKVHLKGVGWTIQGKTYAVVYDNKYLGYVCSFSTRGDIDLNLPAAGEPGPHTIDLYPAVYEGKDPTPDIYSKPNLTYQENHPGGPLPAFRLTLNVTE